MLHINIPATELWDEQKQEFVSSKECNLCLEHSLVSLSKWESKWKKPFLTKEEKTIEETIDYIKCMTITRNVDPIVYYCLPQNVIQMVNEYIIDPMTATTITDNDHGKSSKEIVTSELIYYWMIALNIPVDFEKWHLNRLLTLIKVCNIKNAPPKKMSQRQLMSRNAALNAARRKKLGSKG